MVLAVRQLVVERSDGVRLLGPLDLDLAPGERLGVVGESGSGKTLLARALAGHLPPGVRSAAGRISWPGRPEDPAHATPPAWVPQDPDLAMNPLLNVRQHLALLPAALRREPERAALARLAPLLDHLGLPRDRTFLGRRPYQLSGGQRQRLCLAMALACDPAVLVLDEPTSALDPRAAAAFRDRVLELQRTRGLALVWITHDFTVAAACDRLLVLYGGTAVEAGPAGRILESPRHPYTARLLEAARGLPSREAGFLPAPEARPTGCPFRPRCPDPGPSCEAPGRWRGTPGHGFRCERPLSFAN